MAKAPDAFRTISEVAEALHTPAHVLRFWESKFSQIKPVKRAGGRRYYRPDDIALLAGIKHLLHEQGLTIKGAQKLLRENGVRHVASLVGSPISTEEATTGATPVVESPAPAPEPEVAGAIETAVTPLKVVSDAAPEPSIDLDALTPAEMPSVVPPRWFDASGKLDATVVKGNADAILPLLERLEAVRDRMSAS